MSTGSPSEPSIAELVFIGLNRRVAALDRASGALTWQWKAPHGAGAVALMLDGDRLVASVQGYTYCLDAASGKELWSNKLKGFGLGIACLTSYRSSSMASSMLSQHAQANSAAAAAGAN